MVWYMPGKIDMRNNKQADQAGYRSAAAAQE